MKKNVALKLLTLICVTCLLLGVTVACGSVSGSGCTPIYRDSSQSSLGDYSASENEQSGSDNQNLSIWDDNSSSIDDHEHDYQQQITEPTCEKKGQIVYSCSCGDSYVEEIPALGHNFVNGKCSVCGANEGGNTDKIEIVDGYVYFGEYPQTIKADSVSITSTTNEKGYFLGSDGAWYAGVNAMPYESGYTFSNNVSVTSGTTYYFKVEPIKWQVLSTDGVTAKVVCASIIANHRYDDASNNYAQSEIRAWLNNKFYNQAFTSLQQELIVTTLVDNSAESTGYDPNQYACDDTNDKIYLLSYAEAYAMDSTTTVFSEVRERITSDYSRATGALMYTGTNYYGRKGFWWLRSPNYLNSSYAYYVSLGGDLLYLNFVSYTCIGVVPALQIRL